MKSLLIVLVTFIVGALQVSIAGKPKELNVRTYPANDIEVQIISAETEMLVIGAGAASGDGQQFAPCSDINIGNNVSDPYDLNRSAESSTTIVIKGVIVNQCR
jgi:hypothetical protein